MKIRFFNTYEPVSPFYRDLIPHLTQNDNNLDIEVVVSKTEYREREQLETLFDALPNVKIIRTANLGLQAYQGSLAKAIVTILYAIQATFYSLVGPKSDLNIFLSQPPMIPLLGWLLSIIRKQPYSCVVMDVHPQVAVALGMAKAESFAVRALEWLTVMAWKRANQIVVIGRCMRNTLANLGISNSQIHFIPNWVDEDEIAVCLKAENSLVHANQWTDKFIVMYAGNLGRPQYFDDLLQVALNLQDNEDVRFVFIGDGAKKRSIETFAEKHNLSNVELFPFLHNEYTLSEILGAGDLHFVTLRNGIAGLAVPSKAYGILAAARPIVYQGEEHGEIALMINEDEIGNVVSCGDVASLQEAILTYSIDYELTTAYGQNARNIAEHKYHKQGAMNAYFSLLAAPEVEANYANSNTQYERVNSHELPNVSMKDA